MVSNKSSIKGTMSIGEFAKRIGVKPLTVRRWIYKGLIKPLKTPTGRYRFTEKHINEILNNLHKDYDDNHNTKKVVIYTRVSTSKQKEYLQNQIELCKKYAVSKGYSIGQIITDIASSFNFKRKELNKLLDLVIANEVDTVIIYSKDRLSRIAYELFETIFNKYGVKIEIIDNSEKLHNDYQLKDTVEELISFIHYITAKIYGSRSYKSRKIKKCVEETINEK
jgi:putative resolvase